MIPWAGLSGSPFANTREEVSPVIVLDSTNTPWIALLSMDDRDVTNALLWCVSHCIRIMQLTLLQAQRRSDRAIAALIVPPKRVPGAWDDHQLER